jgi:hypothetical protein
MPRVRALMLVQVSTSPKADSGTGLLTVDRALDAEGRQRGHLVYHQSRLPDGNG